MYRSCFLISTEFYNRTQLSSTLEITLYLLQASRSIRIVWLLEELGLDRKVEFADQEHGVVSLTFKQKSGDTLDRFPLLVDGELEVGESGAETKYV